METQIQNALNEGSGLSFILVFFAGLLSAATPCVLPMIPVTVGIIGASEATSRRRAMFISSLFVCGIIVSFTTLGLFFGLSGSLFGSILANPFVVIALALIYIFLAISAFELFELRLPSTIETRLMKIGGKGVVGAFTAGLVAGFIGLPCVGPILIGILTYVATKNAVIGALWLACYALGFGLPFFIVGTFAIHLPKSGPWIRSIKSLFGIFLLLGAFWFLRNAFPFLRTFTSLAVLGSILFILGCFAGALHLHFDGTKMDRIRKTISILAMTVGGSLCINAIMAPKQNGWCKEDVHGTCMAIACKEYTTTILDFHATWCAACKELERDTLSDSRVVRRTSTYGKVSIDTDDNPDITNQFKIQGIPAIVFLDKNCSPLPQKIIGFVTPEEFLETLDTLENTKP